MQTHITPSQAARADTRQSDTILRTAHATLTPASHKNPQQHLRSDKGPSRCQALRPLEWRLRAPRGRKNGPAASHGIARPARGCHLRMRQFCWLWPTNGGSAVGCQPTVVDGRPTPIGVLEPKAKTGTQCRIPQKADTTNITKCVRRHFYDSTPPAPRCCSEHSTPNIPSPPPHHSLTGAGSGGRAGRMLTYQVRRCGNGSIRALM